MKNENIMKVFTLVIVEKYCIYVFLKVDCMKLMLFFWTFLHSLFHPNNPNCETFLTPTSYP